MISFVNNNNNKLGTVQNSCVGALTIIEQKKQMATAVAQFEHTEESSAAL